MDHGSTALGPASRPPAARGPRYRSQLPHHRRRRRALAFSVIAVLAVAVALAAIGGGQPTRSVAAPAPGFFTRLQTLAGTGPGSFNAAQRGAETAAIERTLAVTPYVRVAGAQHREVALTFDDGPGPYTPRLLSVLHRTNVPGTFFEVGVEEQYFHASTSQIVAAGYPIGDHTESHAPMSRIPPAAQESQLLQQTTAIGAYGAPFPRLFRPPYGLWDNDTLALLRKYRMLMVLWTVDTEDYRQPGVPAIVHSVLSGVKPGAIVLMHDAGGIRTQTIEALPIIIRKLRARGYRLVTVPRLLLDNPPSSAAQAGVVPGGGGG